MADLYYVGGSNNWNSDSWALSSGGAAVPGLRPTQNDNVFCDGNSAAGPYQINGQNLSQSCKNFTYTPPPSGALTLVNFIDWSVYGNWDTASGLINGGSGVMDVYFRGSASNTVMSRGFSFRAFVRYDVTGTTTLLDDLTATAYVEAQKGNFVSGGFAINAPKFLSNNSNVRSVTLGSSVITLTPTGSTTFWDIGGSNLTFSGASATIKLVASVADGLPKTFNGGDKTYGTLWLSGNGGSGNIIINGSNSFSEIKGGFNNARSVLWEATKTNTTAAWNLSGTAGNLVTLKSTVDTSAWNLTKTGAAISADYLSIRDSHATNPSYAGTHSTNVSGNTGWVFTSPPAVITGGPVLLI